ncbi:FeoA domain-containing protein [Thiohalocapsa sp. ML1]|jgi:Fe2+ transport system protein FeoA|uniref:FeoA domain-containing protein n=1 Tax=Thiohalocapsa sp. ML1 TaxID=1431688 RepID=UPI000731FCF4|nr:FeoA domain-containing protein [Thiohalocapsa sp. ML1]
MPTPRNHLLTSSPVGDPVRIDVVTSNHARHRLHLLGIGDEEPLLVEYRGDYGDIIVRVGTRRMHLPEHLARRVRVRRAESGLANDTDSRAA